MSEKILVCEKVFKSYKAGKNVLGGLDLTVESGKIFGLLGPNGCGKSTLLKLISGLLTADSGDIYVCGKKVSEETNALVSFLPERPCFSMRMKVTDILAFYEEFFPDFDRSVAERMLLDLGIDKNAQMKTLSKGNKEKVQLILVMSRSADLYLLDEPIGGVDPATRDYILDSIISNYSEKATVIISTHLISDIEKVLDEVIFIKDGNIVLHESVDEIREREGKSVDELFREVFKC